MNKVSYTESILRQIMLKSLLLNSLIIDFAALHIKHLIDTPLDNFIGTLGNFITSSPSKVDILYHGHNLCSILQPILRMLVRGKL